MLHREVEERNRECKLNHAPHNEKTDVGSDMGGFGEVHEGFGTVKINDGGIRLLD